MKRKPYTGGPLNVLNGKAGISAPENSVSVSGLIRAHNPKSASELEELIADHVNQNCDCCIVSKGTVGDFGRNLYAAQEKYWGAYRFSLKECVQWEYDLFVLQMLKGNTMEEKCHAALSHLLGDTYSIRNTSRYIDEEFRVDLEVTVEQKVIAGVQVKPESFEKVRSSIKEFSKTLNEKFGKPVFYIVYNYAEETLINVEEVAKKIRKYTI